MSECPVRHSNLNSFRPSLQNAFSIAFLLRRWLLFLAWEDGRGQMGCLIPRPTEGIDGVGKLRRSRLLGFEAERGRQIPECLMR